MDCREFRDRHALYVDVRCSAVEESEMREHARQCSRCSRHDTLVRRSLLLVRNLPTIEPSPNFRARLDARLRATVPFSAESPRRVKSASFGAFAALAAGVAFVAFLAADMVRRAPRNEIQMAPVVATEPQMAPSPLATSAFVATVPTGMSVWPAIMVASQAPMHFVAAELASER